MGVKAMLVRNSLVNQAMHGFYFSTSDLVKAIIKIYNSDVRH